jgi:hypothetical protein
MARDDLQQKAAIFGEPTMNLQFIEDKLHQLYILKENHSGLPGTPMHIWVEVGGQDNG